MATDDRPSDDMKPRRRGKAHTITLEANEVTPETAPAGDQPPPPATEGPADSLSAASDVPAEAAANSDPIVPAVDGTAGDTTAPSEAAPTEPVPAAEAPSLVEPPAPEPDGTFQEPAPRALASPSSPPAEPPPAAPAAPGFGRLAAAGLIGALLTAALGAGAQVAGLLPGQNRDQVAALDRRIAELDRAVKEAAARPATPQPAADISPLTRRLDGLDQARAALETRIATLEQRPAAAPPSAAAGTSAQLDLDPVNREIAALKTAVEAIASAQRSLATAGASATQPPATVSPPAVDTAAIDARIRAATQPQTERIAGAELAIQGLRREIEAASAAARAADGKVAALDAARSQTSSSGQKAALVVGIGALRTAVERGGAYAAELRAVQALGLPANAVEPLQAAAERGLPTTGQIGQRFAALAPSLVRAAPTASSGSLMDRIVQGAQGLIRVRPIGEAAGDDVPTVVARIEAKLGRGDLAGALADFGRLPEPVRAIGANWVAEARARSAADEALRRIAADAVNALTGG